MPGSVLSSAWFLTRFSTFCRAMFQVKLKAKNEQKPWRVCNFYDFRLSASEPLPTAFGELFWSRFGRQDGPKIDPKAHPEPTPKTTLQNDPKTAQHGLPKLPQDPHQKKIGPKPAQEPPSPPSKKFKTHKTPLDSSRTPPGLPKAPPGTPGDPSRTPPGPLQDSPKTPPRPSQDPPRPSRDAPRLLISGSISLGFRL